MPNIMYERTLVGEIPFAGVGLHTGQPVSMRVLPAPPGTGVVFRRVDLDDFEIPADVTSVSRVAYATTLMRNGVWISTVEHLLSALYGFGIDNAYVDMDNLEVPILDGSALPFTDAIAEVGVAVQNRPRRYLRILREFSMQDPDGGKSLAIVPADTFEVECAIDFEHPFIGPQSLAVECVGDEYAKAIAPARTFGFERDVETLQSNGLIRGGSLENAIVLSETGMLNSEPLRFADEFVRHKVLDLLGDFALIGRPVLGRLIANRAGHALHTRFVAGLLESPEHWIIEDRLGHPANLPAVSRS
jgi:UDP-3-O-[3-hydroxymyristoyl] N-acetylglucosamine deacetylase